MKSPIEAIFFDVGGTLRTTERYSEPISANIEEILRLSGLSWTVPEMIEKLRQRERVYYRWGTLTMLELTEEELWSRWLLPEIPPERIKKIAIRLNQLWRDAKTKKTLMADATDTLKELLRRGYRLGVISNTTSSTEVPALLEEMGIADQIETVVLTTEHGRRKPHPSVFLTATKELGITPDRAVYVGDRPSRDVVGAREAGIAQVIIIQVDGKEPEKEIIRQKPDHTIRKLSELLDIFPERDISNGKSKPGKVSPLYDCSISTMWGIDRHEHFNEFFVECRKLGFARFELNHQISPERMAEIDFNRFHINSLHEPCPVEISLQEMDRRDWLISSPDEAKRAIAVAKAKQTIDQAVSLGCRYIVIHPGTTRVDRSKEKQLRALYENGQVKSVEFISLQNDYILERNHLVAPHLDSCIKSLKEIGEYAFKAGIAVGLENRYHYYDLPNIDEMQELLDLFDDDRWGFIYDVGHAHTLDRLGFFKHKEWLTRYGKRMIGTHLHDVVGLTDHQAPGSGEVDYTLVASHLPISAFKVLEVMPSLTPAQISHGLECLAEYGCISKY